MFFFSIFLPDDPSQAGPPLGQNFALFFVANFVLSSLSGIVVAIQGRGPPEVRV